VGFLDDVRDPHGRDPFRPDLDLLAILDEVGQQRTCGRGRRVIEIGRNFRQFLRIEGEETDRELNEGDWILLPARCHHRVTWTRAAPPTVWLAIHVAVAEAPAHSKG